MDNDAILKALAHPVRREMLAWLRSPKSISPGRSILWKWAFAPASSNAAAFRSRPFPRIWQRWPPPALHVRRVGQWVFYRRNEETIAAFRAALSNL